MENSVIIISIILVASVFVPFFLFIYNGTKNTSNTKKQINALLEKNGLSYGLTEIWRKNFIGISKDHNMLTYINLKEKKPIINNIKLNDISQCNIIKHQNNDLSKFRGLKSLQLELVFVNSRNPTVLLTFFNIDDDLSEDFEMPRIEKWQKLITNSITPNRTSKLAS